MNTKNSQNRQEKKLTTSNIKNILKTYARLLTFAKKHWMHFIFGVIGTLVATSVDAALAWIIKPFIDDGLVARNKVVLYWLPIVIIVSVVVRGAAYFVSNYYLMRVGRSIVMELRQKVFDHIVDLPAKFFDKGSSGRLLTTLTYSTEQVALATTQGVLTVFQEGMTLIGLVVVMFLISWKLSLLFVVVSPVVYIVIKQTSRRLQKLGRKVQKTMGDVVHIAEECLGAYRVMKIFCGEKHEKQKFAEATATNRNREMKVITTDCIGGSLVQIITALPIVLIIYVAMMPIFKISVGSFGALVTAVLRLLTPLRRLTKINTEIQKGITGAECAFELLDTPVEENKGHLKKQILGNIKFENVSFKYQTSTKNVLGNINFEIRKGEKIALVGKSGSGKSTLINLISRFYDVSSGNITIDGISIYDYELQCIRNQISLVSQNISLFNDTIEKNIAYGYLDTYDREKILQAAEAAHVTEFVGSLPNGFDTIAGKDGMMLSGGQRQRIAIARAILKDAPILILDEATSSLDAESEGYIQDSLSKLMKNRTTIIIAHRLSTVKSADEIIVLDRGRIVEEGSHEDLTSNSNSVYAKLYAMQFKD